MAYITHIHVENCRNVKQLDIDLSVPAVENGAGSAPAFRHLILTGPNGSGKSGVLEAVAAQLPEPFTEVWKNKAQGKILVRWNAASNYAWDAFTNGAFVSVYLPARRRIAQQQVAGPSRLDLHLQHLGAAAEVSNRFLQFLVNKRTDMALAAEEGDQASVERIRSWFANFEAYLRRMTEDDGLVVDFDRRAFHFRFRRSDGYTFDINTLADGHAAILTILAELLIRIDIVRDARKDFHFDPEGVVVIDEVEAHLHLSLQEKVLPFLTTLFPRIQFLVATHSPAVIASIPNAVVYDLAKHKQFLSDHLRGVRYGTLMTEHFGISSEIDLDSTEKLLRLRELVGRSSRTTEDDRELADLSALLSARSPALAVEVWMAKERLGAPRNGVTTGDRS